MTVLCTSPTCLSVFQPHNPTSPSSEITGAVAQLNLNTLATTESSDQPSTSVPININQLVGTVLSVLHKRQSKSRCKGLGRSRRGTTTTSTPKTLVEPLSGDNLPLPLSSTESTSAVPLEEESMDTSPPVATTLPGLDISSRQTIAPPTTNFVQLPMASKNHFPTRPMGFVPLPMASRTFFRDTPTGSTLLPRPSKTSTPLIPSLLTLYLPPPYNPHASKVLYGSKFNPESVDRRPLARTRGLNIRGLNVRGERLI